jgi:hypothetical protein
MKHLDEANETYFQHFKVAFSIAMIALLISIVGIIHAFMPFLFEKTGSKLLEKALDIKNNR